ncbi:MAG: hypothetical protein ACKPJD_31305, partial [Planctomycetaceae bacterium]
MSRLPIPRNSRLTLALLSLLTLLGFVGLLSTAQSFSGTVAATQVGTAAAKSKPKSTKQQAAGFQLREVR